ncbi:hypothetical protein ES708_11985 [subsurface metagenome]
MASDWHKNLVNLYQSAEERQAKYRLCRQHGANSYTAFRYRDWGWQKIARRYGFESAGDMFLAMGIDPTTFQSWRDDPTNPNAWNFDPELAVATN